MELLPKSYNPQAAQEHWYAVWKNLGVMNSAPSEKKPYSILMPPPNVTGILHFGHILNHTIQDIYIRWNRQLGNETCWFPGLDHAGIATQTKVEQDLKAQGVSRHDLGREKFVEKVWDWKNKYGNIILNQLETLGDSADWDRTLFTLDTEASNLVRDTFIDLYNEGLIYRGKRIINWSPAAQSALSDEEVTFKEVREKMATLRYRLADGSGTLLVATVRAETIFADVAVAVNPNDERYKHLIGSMVIVPLSNTQVPIIADEYADPEFGTGCVKVTPAHDPNDYQIGLRHNLPMPVCINPDATLNERAGEFAGLDRFAARKKVIAALEAQELLENLEDYTHNVGFSERGGEVVEPYLSSQWFVKMESLATPALEAVRSGQIKFYPEHWVKTYEHWMTNVHDWCISRQLWWGHRIPVYYTPTGEFVAAKDEREARTLLGVDNSVDIYQDPDVLDTWFSSWLWPISTMQSREKTGADVSDFYAPSNLLVTGPDIIFFWVARMIAITLKYKKQVPFKDVYFTSIVRDSRGRKLSKSLGNSPDPLEIISKYGSDAVRFTMIYLSPLGTDVRLDVDEKTQDIASMELGRNFANKVWNAARFLQMKHVDTDQNVQITGSFALSTADKWIRSRFATTLQQASAALAAYKLTDYTKAIHEFIWRDFCDWYIEVVKVQFNSSTDPVYRAELLAYAFNVLRGALQVLHPIMPFLTEELWHGVFGASEDSSISVAPLPILEEGVISAETEEKFELLQSIVESVRRQRGEMVIAPSEKLPVVISCNQELVGFLREQELLITSFTKASELSIGHGLEAPTASVSDVIKGVETYLVVEGKIDIPKERERLTKEHERLLRMIAQTEKKLGNPGFVNGASAEVVDGEKKKLADWSNSVEKITRNLKALA